MPRKEVVIITQSAQKRLNEEIVTRAPVKKWRVATMKELAEEFNKKKNRKTGKLTFLINSTRNMYLYSLG